MAETALLVLKLAVIVAGVVLASKTAWGRFVGDFLPTPFWIYFVPIVLSTLGLLPQQHVLYTWATKFVLPAAIVLMLIGAPVNELISLGSRAFLALVVGTVSIWIASIVVYAALLKFLPADGWQATGALLGTWIGGSANMLAVKEILNMTDEGLAPIILVDTVLSYAWMALLLVAVRFQNWFDRGLRRPPIVSEDDSRAAAREPIEPARNLPGNGKKSGLAVAKILVSGFVAALLTWLLVIIGRFLSQGLSFLSAQAWTLLAASIAGVGLACSSLRALGTWGESSKIGSLLLYFVLVTIGAKTTLGGFLEAPVYMVAGILILLIHGGFSMIVGRIFGIPLFLLSTSSQANIGGAISAPIVAEAYRPGTAHIGVLMAIVGAVIGTYLGVLGGYTCRFVAAVIQ